MVYIYEFGVMFGTLSEVKAICLLLVVTIELGNECRYPTVCVGNECYLWTMPFGLRRFILKLSIFTIRQLDNIWLPQCIGTKTI